MNLILIPLLAVFLHFAAWKLKKISDGIQVQIAQALAEADLDLWEKELSDSDS